MSKESPPIEDICAAIENLAAEDLIRLQHAARVFDARRHEDLLQEAMCRTISGVRKWRRGISLFWHLHEAMRSIAWAWDRKIDEKPVPESQSGVTDGDMAFVFVADPAASDPEARASNELTLERIFGRYETDPVVLGLLTGKLEGKTGREIREELGLSQKEFSAAAQRLRRSGKALVRRRRYA